jgi:hypothetical protein
MWEEQCNNKERIAMLHEKSSTSMQGKWSNVRRTVQEHKKNNVVVWI